MQQDFAEFNFHDHTLIPANDSQNISETSNSDYGLSSASTEKKTSSEKIKDFLKTGIIKKLKETYQKNKRLAYRETWHTRHKECHEFLL